MARNLINLGLKLLNFNHTYTTNIYTIFVEVLHQTGSKPFRYRGIWDALPFVCGVFTLHFPKIAVTQPVPYPARWASSAFLHELYLLSTKHVGRQTHRSLNFGQPDY